MLGNSQVKEKQLTEVKLLKHWQASGYVAGVKENVNNYIGDRWADPENWENSLFIGTLF